MASSSFSRFNPYSYVTSLLSFPVSACLPFFALLISAPIMFSETLTISAMDQGNLLAHGEAATSNWQRHPEGSALIELLPNVTGEGQPTIRMQAGGSVLALHSRRIPVEPNTAYSLAYDLKQESIYVGFGMGGGPTIRWFDGTHPTPTVLFFEKMDGSFDWQTVSYSFVSPPQAREIQISLGKSGAPGEVFFRNVRFAKGTLKRTLNELRPRDYATQAEAFSYFIKRLEVFHAVRGKLTNATLQAERDAIALEAMRGREIVLKGAVEQKLEITPALEQQVVWAEMLKGSQGFQVTPDSPYYDAWRALHERLENYCSRWSAWVEEETPARIAREMAEHYGAARPYGIGISSPMWKISDEIPYTGPIARQARIELARNEEEATQLTLIAQERALGKIGIEIGELKHKESGKKWSGGVEVLRVDQVTTSQPQYHTVRQGKWPDILQPSAEVSGISKGGLHSFWINLAAEADAPAGVYEGIIRITEDGKLLEELPLEVTLWDLTLPRPGRFKVVGRFSPNQLKLFYNWEREKPEVIANWNRFIFRKRWNSTDPFVTGLSPNREGLKAALEQGMNAVNLLNVSQLLKQDRTSRTFEWPDAETEQKLRHYIRTARDDFRKAAGESSPTQLYIFGFDEQHDRSQYPLMKHVFKLAKEEVPEAKTITTTTYSPLEALLGSVDAWVPLLGSETPELQARSEVGEERWFYIYAHPFHPFPNASLVDYPGVDGRATFWLASRMGYQGFLHWLMNGFRGNSEGDIRWPKAAWNPASKGRNGEGCFLYPGENEMPISSIRFELIRDGIEDWELLEMLREAVGNAPEGSPVRSAGEAALRQAEALTPSAKEYSLDPQALMLARSVVAKALLQLQESRP